jgi:mannosyl-oligosaccharide alpha-1,2-mannosidase
MLQVAGGMLLAEVSSLSMEFTRLSMLTGDAKWFDAVQRITDEMAAQQDSTALPGLWPMTADGAKKIFNAGDFFTLGAMADSVYEYLPKMAAMMGGRLPMYQTMY